MNPDTQSNQTTPQNITPQKPKIDPDNPLSVMQPGEEVVCVIKRHPIGLINTYIAGTFIIVLVAVLGLVVAPQYLTQYDQSQVLDIGVLAFIVISLAVFGFVWVSNKVYVGNRWIVTTDSITQITQNSLFDRQSSQLSLANLEDITSEQNGMFAHMYNYGVLRAETAGERSKFRLLYCPNPDHYAQLILDAREKFEQFGGRRGDYDTRASGTNVNTAE